MEKYSNRPGYVLIFRRWTTHPVTKKIIYPKRGKVFPIWIKTNGEQLDLNLD
jgi:hypothetical protein